MINQEKASNKQGVHGAKHGRQQTIKCVVILAGVGVGERPTLSGNVEYLIFIRHVDRGLI